MIEEENFFQRRLLWRTCLNVSMPRCTIDTKSPIYLSNNYPIVASRKRKKVKIKRSTFKNELRYLVIITFVCLILAFVLAFVTGKIPSFVDRTIQKQADRIAGEKMEDIKGEIMEKVKKENMEDIIKKYKDKAQGLR